MSIELSYILREKAGAAASRVALIDFVSDRMIYLLRILTNSYVKVAERHLSRVKSVPDPNNELTSAASNYEVAAENYLSAYHEEERRFFGGNKEEKLNDLRAAISCYLSAGMCYKAKGASTVTHELMARAGRVFYSYYVEAQEMYSIGRSLADGQVHRITEGSPFSAIRRTPQNGN